MITASNALQFSHESVISSRDAAEPSIFTPAIVDGLLTGAADLDFDGRITVDERYEYIYQRGRSRLPNQTPTLSVASAEGTLVLARNVQSHISQLPAEIVKASRSPLSWQRAGRTAGNGPAAADRLGGRLWDDPARTFSSIKLKLGSGWSNVQHRSSTR